jgi:two-component system, OmpR family, alkaline phosphatase synthesis response regulator PhoP
MSISRRLSERSVRGPEPPRRVYECGRLRIDFDAYEVWVDGHSVHLLRREYELLRFFVESPNRVFDRTQILAHVWPRARINPRTVDVHVYRLRHCLERDPEHPELFVTVRGVGWRFDERTLREARGTVEAQHVDSNVRQPSDGSC